MFYQVSFTYTKKQPLAITCFESSPSQYDNYINITLGEDQ
jgi:hypothetical protein